MRCRRPSDDVTINLGGNPTIQITTGSQSVHSLTSKRSNLDQRRVVIGRRHFEL